MKYFKKLFHQLRDKLKIFNLKFLSYVKNNKNFVLIMFIICGIVSIGIYISYAYFSDIISRNLFTGSVESFSSPHLNIKYMVEDRDENGIGTGAYTAYWNAPEKEYIYIPEKTFCTNGATFIRNSDDTFDVSSPGKTRCEFYYDAADLTVDSDIKITVLKEIGETCKSGTCEYEEVPDYTINSIINLEYKFIIEKSTCTGDSFITYDEINNKLTTSAVGKTECRAYFDIVNAVQYDYVYTGDYQEFTVVDSGVYKIELWGAYKGAYTMGYIELNQDETLYIYVGERGYNTTYLYDPNSGGYNGGGLSGYATDDTGVFVWTGGGGATDIRTVKGTWNNTASLRSRIMVSGGGGGTGGLTGTQAGGLIGYNGGYYQSNPYSSPYTVATGGTQTSGGTGGVGALTGYSGTFGIGGNVNGIWGSGGGGGYYGGGGASNNAHVVGSGAGGSSYISGHMGAVAITSSSNQAPKSGCTTGTTNINCSYHYSGYVFTNTVMIDGAGYNWTNVKGEQVPIPNPLGGFYELGVMHTGNGHAKITGPL